MLDVDVVQSEAVHFAGFPGLWLADRPIAVSELGFATDDDAYAAVDELGLPLAQTTVAEGAGLMPEVANHVPAGVVPVFDHLEAVDGNEVVVADPYADAVAANADVLIESIAATTEVDVLDGLEAAETAGKSRTTVLQAITDRRAELAPEPEVES